MKNNNLKPLSRYEFNKKAKLEFIASNLELTNQKLSDHTGLNIRTVQRYKKHIKKNNGLHFKISHGNKNQNRTKKITDQEIQKIYKDYLNCCKQLSNSNQSTKNLNILEYYNLYLGSDYKTKISYHYLIQRLNNQGLRSVYRIKTKPNTKSKCNKNISLSIKVIENQINE
ncbi:hypothetical protein [Mycoplasma bradburyae]|uniref:hypothetical protein n=1 Tax=Mycoplasma bradburyae TaxID=2963128 RepID=UPI0023408D69|nr:hypothetical protein [Mycoplasma bradburyae]MDC4184032.1 hypothetical protein [Mycoplasma bradburyae]